MLKVLFMLCMLLVVIACTPQQSECTEEAKLCEDGTVVGREGPNCEFSPCPLNCDQPYRKYQSRETEVCERIRFMCAPGLVPFSDACGCGCEEKPKQQNKCMPKDRKIDACIELYQPVCGWFDAEKIQCIKYPCAQTFSNGCFACMNENIEHWTEGECPA